MNKLFLLIVIVSTSVYNIEANTERDSLLNLLNSHNEKDIVRVDLLLQITQTYWFADSLALPYLKEAISISESQNYIKGLTYGKYWYTNYLRSVRRGDSIPIVTNQIDSLSKAQNYIQGTGWAYLALLELNFWREKNEVVLEYYEKIKAIYHENGKSHMMIKSSILAGISYQEQGKVSIGRKCIEEAESLIAKRKVSSLKASELYYLTFYYSLFEKNYNDYKRHFNSLLFNLKNLNDLNALAKVYRRIGGEEYNFGNYSKYLENTYRAFELYQELNDSIGVAQSTEILCWIYYLLKDYEKSKYYGKYSLTLCEKFKIRGSVANNLCNLGLILLEQDSLVKAKDYFQKGLDKSVEEKFKFYISWNCVGLALVADKQMEFDKAYDYYQNALNNRQTMGMHDVSYLHSFIANHFILTKDYRMALIYADSAFNVSVEANAPDMTQKAAEVLYKIHAHNKNFKLAYKYSSIYNHLTDSLKSHEAKQLGLVYEFEKTIRDKELEQKQKDLLNKQKLKQQKSLRNIFIGGFLLVIVLCFFIYRNYLHKQKANRLLREHQDEIEAQNNELSQQNDEILSINEALNEQKELVEERNAELHSQNEEILAQRDQLSEQNKMINESMLYAKRIQTAVLPRQDYIDETFLENFIIFKPRNIVSGDFYWVRQINQYKVIAVADCTGHGIPGAILSMLGMSFLSEIIQKREITKTNQALNELRKQIKLALRQTGRKGETDDGMDIALCAYDTKTKELQYAGANNPLYLIQNGELKEIKADRMPIGFYPGAKPSFTNHEIQLKDGDIFYLFSDGFIDQFGGKKGFKFRASSFQKILIENHQKPMVIQKELLQQELDTWMKGYEQTDDILVMGVRV